mmetsp:Transcript_67696/g.175356  ORF Transcript_67696/g.175356 Transcript_67696/m.175356 type:complete len:268 (-) Transcript_67696:905-1708(-)
MGDLGRCGIEWVAPLQPGMDHRAQEDGAHWRVALHQEGTSVQTEPILQLCVKPRRCVFSQLATAWPAALELAAPTSAHLGGFLPPDADWQQRQNLMRHEVTQRVGDCHSGERQLRGCQRHCLCAVVFDLYAQSLLVGLCGPGRIPCARQVAYMRIERRHLLPEGVFDEVRHSGRRGALDAAKHQLAPHDVLRAAQQPAPCVWHVVREQRCRPLSRLEAHQCRPLELELSTLEVVVQVQHERVDAALAVVVHVHTIAVRGEVLMRAIA